MKRVGFFLSPSLEWIGGINYFRNLFYAVSEVNDASVKMIVFVSKNIDASILDMLTPPGQTIRFVRTSMLQRYSPYWFIWKFFRKVFRSEIAAFPLCAYYGINVVSHSDFFKIPRIKIINWIPDFQHIHFPKMFKSEQICFLDSYHLRCIKSADIVVVSSKDAAGDLIGHYRNSWDKVFILPFVSQVPDFYFNLDQESWNLILSHYQLEKYFFYIPNQFYKHKNQFVLVLKKFFEKCFVRVWVDITHKNLPSLIWQLRKQRRKLSRR